MGHPPAKSHDVTNERLSQEGLVLGEEEVLVGVFDAHGKQQLVASAMDKDGGVWWKQEIRPGQPTFEQVYLANRCVGWRVCHHACLSAAAVDLDCPCPRIFCLGRTNGCLD